MNRHTIPLGRILKIPIGLDYSWFLIFALLTWIFAVGYYPRMLQGSPSSIFWLLTLKFNRSYEQRFFLLKFFGDPEVLM